MLVCGSTCGSVGYHHSCHGLLASCPKDLSPSRSPRWPHNAIASCWLLETLGEVTSGWKGICLTQMTKGTGLFANPVAGVT